MSAYPIILDQTIDSSFDPSDTLSHTKCRYVFFSWRIHP
jgi:hypothetical protein